MDQIKKVIQTAKEALESCAMAFEECRDYPITHDMVTEALDEIYAYERANDENLP